MDEEEAEEKCQGIVMWKRFHSLLLALKIKIGHKPRYVAAYKAEKYKERDFFPTISRKSHSHAETLILVQ